MTNSIRSRPARLLLTMTTVAAATTAITATPAVAAPSGPCGSIYGQRATAVGLPTLPDQGHAQSGAVDVRSYDHTASRVSLSTLTGSAATTGARFGAAVVIQDVDHDGCEDLLIGAPGGTSVVGTVRIVRGTPSGVSAAGSITITAPDAKVGDSFGAAIAVGHVYGDGTQDLWIGAPDATVGGKARAGKVYHYILDGNGVATYRGEAGYAAAAVPGDSAAGDRFGSVLAISSGYFTTTSYVVVGVPLRDVGGHSNAGEIAVLHQDPGGPITGDVRSQASSGVPGTPEAGDHFGAAVSVHLLNGDVLAVGIPGENVGSIVDAGAVQMFGIDRTQPGATTITAGAMYTSDSPGVPGVAETGDRFGASVAVLSGSAGEDPYAAVAIGSPGESIGSVARAGTVTFLVVGGSGQRPPNRVVYQGSGAPGRAETDDNFGETMATVKGEEVVDDHPTDSFLTGVPGEDGLRHDSGLAQPADSSTSYGSVTGPIAGLRYGSVLAQAGPGDQFVV